MLNLIRMDLYRMVRLKSIYITFIIYSLITAMMTKVMSISLTIEGVSSQVPTVAEIQEALMTQLIMALFMFIFAAIFLVSDVSGWGFVKSYIGQVKHRSYRILSKFVCLCIYSVGFLAASTVLQIVFCGVFLGRVDIGDTGDYMALLGRIFVMYLALMCVILFVSALAKGLVMPVITAVLLSMQFPQIITELIDLLLEYVEIDFSVTKYELIHYIPYLRLGSTQIGMGNTEVSFVMMLAVCYIVIFTAASCFVYEKRDIV